MGITMISPSISRLAIPGATLLVSFLSYTSQLLFNFIEPGRLARGDEVKFNVLVICLFLSYYRACTTDPGRIGIDSAVPSENPGFGETQEKKRNRWCRKCERVKPPRAHHCKTCQRCIPKMDHHCPWTANCISHITFPHFVRFIFYAVAAMCYLEYFLYLRVAILWSHRMLPSYLGPSHIQLIHLFLLVVVNSLTLFALSILLIRTLWTLGSNVTTIESWEIERHETLLRRARRFGGYLDGPDGTHMRIRRQEFPYDLGIWNNIKQGMGSGNPIFWLFPLSSSPTVESGLKFEVNAFEDSSLLWPPPDPDRIPRKASPSPVSSAYVFDKDSFQNELSIEAFRRRQQEDIRRRSPGAMEIQRRRPFLRRLEMASTDGTDSEVSDSNDQDGEEGWKNSEGERLADFGVDEWVEFYDEDEMPLQVLMRMRREAQNQRNPL